VRLADSRAEGTLVRANPDSIWLFRGDTLGYARSSIHRVQIYKGRTRSADTGLLIGVGVGALASVVLVPYATNPQDYVPPDEIPDTGTVILSCVITGAAL